MAITDDERREVARWAAACAERVLPLFEAVAPGDSRPRRAIEAASGFAAGGGRSRELTRIALAAHRAGGEVGDPVGLAVARSASLAAATANIHGEGTIGTLGHILGPPAYAALASELVSGDGAGEASIELAAAQAPATVRALVARVPPGKLGRPGKLGGRRLDELQLRLETLLRG